MSGVKRVARVFVSLRETRNAAELPKSRKILFAAAQNLMRVGLMSDIPDDFIFRRTEAQIHGHRELHDAEIAREMSARLRAVRNQKAPDFGRERPPFRCRYTAYVRRSVDLIQSTHNSLRPQKRRSVR